MFEVDEIYPVSEFVKLCAISIKTTIPPVWISGEISNLSTPSSGHIYFSIKDKKSQLRCVLFKFSSRNLKFELENGMEVMLRGAPNLYEARGDFQMIVQRVEPIGVGSLELGFEQLKQKLQEQGLFDEVHKKPLIKFPNNIGVITSQNGAVIQDIINILAKRYPFANIKIYDTPTQGDGASIKIINALNKADIDNNDTLIIARGGGSREDLWCFNNEDLAIAVFEAKTTIISGIGHETDTSIIDFVADIYAPTPSAAAVIATPDKLELLQNCKNLTTRLSANIVNKLNIANDKIIKLEQRLNHPNFNKYYQSIDTAELSIKYLLKNTIKVNNLQITNLITKLLSLNPQNLLQIKIQKNQQLVERLLQINQNIAYKKLKIADLKERIINLSQHKIFLEKNTLGKNISALNHLSPLKVLDRGYSITSNKNIALSSGGKLKDGDILITRFIDGEIKSVVRK